MKKGTFILSFDAELIWGRLHLKDYTPFIKRAEKVHETLPQLLKILDRYKIPATWAVVGHIMLSNCKKETPAHPDIVRPQYTYLDHDWFDKDPGTNEEKASAWYGKSLLKEIQSYGYHEIASHTFSHFYWGDPGFTKASAESDLRAWALLAQRSNIQATSFIFPKNSIKYLNLIKQFGFTAYRGQDIAWHNALPENLQQFGQLIELFIPHMTKTMTPSKNNGLINIPGSFYFPSGRGIRSKIPRGVRSDKARFGIDKAIKRGEYFHMWTHPIDFSDDTDKLIADFKEIVKYAASMRDQGKLEIATMQQVTKKFAR